MRSLKFVLVPFSLWLFLGGTDAFGGVITGTVGSNYRSGIDSGNEIIASNFGTHDWTGILEFDLALLGPVPNPSITLHLFDSGGLTSGLSSTRVFIYSGDGTSSQSDLSIASLSSFDITRGFDTGVSQHDVTAVVNDILASGGTHAGFRFEPITGGGGQDAFGFAGSNELVFSDNPDVGTVPEPSSLAVFGICACAVGISGRRRTKKLAVAA